MDSFDIKSIIGKVEEKWLDQLISFVTLHFSSTFLPSHDHTHHIRTWHLTRKILLEIAKRNDTIDEDYVEAALFAAMFHDTGMVETREPIHGEKGMEIYLRFIGENGSELPVNHSAIARAINLHDRKTLDIFIPFQFDKQPDLLTLISIADDLDALGAIGIYRYAEIYLHRKISLKTLGIRIMQNVATRYNHFSKAAVLFPSITKPTREAYQEIISFFDHYNQQLLIDDSPETTYSGHIGIINYIRNFSVEGKIKPGEYLQALNNFIVTKFVLDYFKKLDYEFKKTTN